MKTFKTPGEMNSWSVAERSAGRKIAFVPTMGALHDGHLSLLRRARKMADRLVLSIYINPAQFGPSEDLSRYPRDLEGDIAKTASIGVDALFLPTDEAIYPRGFQTFVDVEEVSKPLCGLSRPGHFRGVATVVAKLLNIVAPDVAIFGEKDFQQLAMIRRMVADLNMPVEIAGCPIVREPDGLAMSSRNRYLSADERIAALSLNHSLLMAQGLIDDGETDPVALLKRVRLFIEETGLAKIDYANLVDPDTLLDLEAMRRPALLALAVVIGKTRLIDNRLFI